MIKDSILANTAKESSLENMTVVNFKNNSRKRQHRSLTAPLMLTSLIDVFSILVVYLLINFSTSGDISYVSRGIELPSAENGIELERHVIVKLENGRYFVDENEVPYQELTDKLLEHKNKFIEENKDVKFPATLVLQADKNEEYKDLNHIISAGAYSGYSDIKFVVLVK